MGQLVALFLIVGLSLWYMPIGAIVVALLALAVVLP
jgi:hypothetical protein